MQLISNAWKLIEHEKSASITHAQTQTKPKNSAKQFTQHTHGREKERWGKKKILLQPSS